MIRKVQDVRKYAIDDGRSPGLAAANSSVYTCSTYILFVEHDDACGDAGAVEEVCGQANDALEVARANELLGDRGLGITAEES